MMKKLIPGILITIGLLICGYEYWKMIDGQKQVNATLQSARALVELQTHKDSSAFMPEVGDAIGILEIERLGAKLPIVEGTDAEDLAKGVGHFKESYLPNENGQIVLSGHRDTVFRRTGELKKGDQLTMKLPYGDFLYEIETMKIVDKNDTSIITLQQDKEELILTTCYPFSYIGPAPKRYIIYGKRV
ncbi:class D sortase [Bacillus sp. NPDC077027]|uniref:class D sortase n=1 Tax=Bacillus sp. NPDC077027 TaxID=3390548 RepID=UPI003D008024